MQGLAERSRRAVEFIEEARASETAFKREKAELVDQNEAVLANFRRLRAEWQTERADLLRQLSEAVQELEEHRRMQSSQSQLFKQPHTAAILEQAQEISVHNLVAADLKSSPADSPIPSQPLSPLIQGNRLPDVVERPPLLQALEQAAINVLGLLSEVDEEILAGNLVPADQNDGCFNNLANLDTVLEAVEKVREAVEERAMMVLRSFGKEKGESSRNVVFAGESLLTVFQASSVPDLRSNDVVAEAESKLEPFAPIMNFVCPVAPSASVLVEDIQPESAATIVDNDGTAEENLKSENENNSAPSLCTILMPTATTKYDEIEVSPIPVYDDPVKTTRSEGNVSEVLKMNSAAKEPPVLHPINTMRPSIRPREVIHTSVSNQENQRKPDRTLVSPRTLASTTATQSWPGRPSQKRLSFSFDEHYRLSKAVFNDGQRQQR